MNTTSKVTLVPMGTLSGRLRAIASAINFARKYQKPMEIIWFTDESLNCPSNRLFTLNPLLAEEHITIREGSWYDRLRLYVPKKSKIFLAFPYLIFKYHTFISPIEVREMVDKHPKDLEQLFTLKKNVLIVTDMELGPYQGGFDEIESSVEVNGVVQSLLAEWTENVVGIHIARGNNPRSRNISPTELFIKRMQSMIIADPSINFFIATDNMDERERLATIFEGRISTPYTTPNTDTPKGIINAFGELLALSKTRMILCTKDSGFSQLAAVVGEVPLEVISIYSEHMV